MKKKSEVIVFNSPNLKMNQIKIRLVFFALVNNGAVLPPPTLNNLFKEVETRRVETPETVAQCDDIYRATDMVNHSDCYWWS